MSTFIIPKSPTKYQTIAALKAVEDEQTIVNAIELGKTFARVKRDGLYRESHGGRISALGIHPDEAALYQRKSALKALSKSFGMGTTLGLANSGGELRLWTEGVTVSDRTPTTEERMIIESEFKRLESDWTNLLIKFRDDFFSEKRRCLDMTDPHRNYTLVHIAVQPLSRYPITSGAWQASSTRWMDRSDKSPFKQTDISQNAAISKLIDLIDKNKNYRLPMPYDPMNEPC